MKQLEAPPAIVRVACVQLQPVIGSVERNLATMAKLNDIIIACADRIGTERGQPCVGQGLTVSPEGWLLAGPTSGDAEGTLFATVSMGQSLRHRAVRAWNAVFADRSIGIYG